jgi:oligoendopeptidase F
MVNTERTDGALKVRGEVAEGDTWDLASLFSSDGAWEAALADWEGTIPGFVAFAGTLGRSPEDLAACLAYDVEVDRTGDRLGTYAHLRASEDQGAPEPQRMVGRFQHVATSFAEKTSFLRPEILAIPAATLDAWIALPILTPYRIGIERLVRTRPHVLSEREEKLLAMQGTFAGTAAKVFRQLTDTDMKFGSVVDGNPKGVSTVTKHQEQDDVEYHKWADGTMKYQLPYEQNNQHCHGQTCRPQNPKKKCEMRRLAIALPIEPQKDC